MAEESAIGVSDIVTAELIECCPPCDDPIIPPLPETDVDSPVRVGFTREIERVGAEPPPFSARIVDRVCLPAFLKFLSIQLTWTV